MAENYMDKNRLPETVRNLYSGLVEATNTLATAHSLGKVNISDSPCVLTGAQTVAEALQEYRRLDPEIKNLLVRNRKEGEKELDEGKLERVLDTILGSGKW